MQSCLADAVQISWLSPIWLFQSYLADAVQISWLSPI